MAVDMSCEGLFKMKNLSHLKVVCIDGNIYVDDFGLPTRRVEDVFANLIEMHKYGFDKRGGLMTMDLVYETES